MTGAKHSTLPGRSLPDGGLGARLGRLRRPLSALSFWGAIALPAVYLPLLAAGIETTGGLTAFLLLFGLHVFALVGGRQYGRATGR